MKKLSQYAKEQGIGYRAAWVRYTKGKITGAFLDTSNNRVLVPDEQVKRPDYIIIYSRVSSSENKSNLDSQAQILTNYAIARGYQIKQIIKETGSGLNDKRPKLLKMLNEPQVTKVIVEHHDRLTRFGFVYLQEWMRSKGCEIEVVNDVANDKEDLMKDFISLVTCFCAKLYGLRRTKRKTERIIQEISNDTD